VSESVVETVPVSGDPRLAFAAREVTVDWSTTLASATSYSVVVERGAVVGDDGVAFESLFPDAELSFSTAAPAEIALVSVTPELGAIDVPLDTNVTLTFDAQVSAGQSGNLTVVNATNLAVVHTILIGDTTVVAIDGETITVDLPFDLEFSTEYFVTLDADAVQSIDGAAFAGFSDESVIAFTTVSPPELTLVSTAPMNGATDVDPNTPLVFTFSEPIATGAGSISVFAAGDDTPVAAVLVSDLGVALSSDTVTVALPSVLENATEYHVLVDPGFVLSLLGSPFAGIALPTDFVFTTADAPPEPLTLVATEPENGATLVPASTDLVLTFDQDVRPGAGNVSIYEEDGSPFEVISVTSDQVDVAGGTVTVNPTGNLRGNTTYYVLIGAGSFESLDGASYAGLSDTSAFRFSTENTFGVVSLSPADGATDVDPATDLVLTFSEAVELGSGGISVLRTSGTVTRESFLVPDARLSIASNVVTIDLDGLLSGDTAYHVFVDAGTIQQAEGGEPFEGIVTPTDWNFTTQAVDEPGDVAAGLVLWLDADHSESLKDQPQVRYWADRSGQASDVANAVSSERPVRIANAIGARPAVRFDGVDDALYAAAGLNFTSTEGFIVWQSDLAPSSSAKRSLFLNGENLEVNHSHPFAPASVAACAAEPCNSGAWQMVGINPPPAANTVTLWNFGFDSVTTSVFASAQGGAVTFQSGPTTVAATPKTPLAIGGDEEGCEETDGCAFKGDIAEVIVYSRRLTQLERLAVIEYLRDKWSVPQVACGSGEVLADNGNCYYVQTGSSNWNAARDTCVARGGGWALATVRSQLDHEEITGLLAGANLSDAWLGATDAEVTDTWRWVTDTLHFWSGGSATNGGAAANGSYANWRDGEPSAGGGENCGRYNLASGAWSWSDATCESSYPAICQGPGN
jgi:methionine-rich copper-binding protein CopC